MNHRAQRAVACAAWGFGGVAPDEENDKVNNHWLIKCKGMVCGCYRNVMRMTALIIGNVIVSDNVVVVFVAAAD